MPQRYFIVGITAVAAMWMYIDRVCFSTLANPMKIELLLPLAPEPSDADELSEEEVSAAKRKKHEANPKLSENEIVLTPDEIITAK